MGAYTPDIGRPLARPIGWSRRASSPCSHGERLPPRARTSLSLTELSLISNGRTSLAGPYPLDAADGGSLVTGWMHVGPPAGERGTGWDVGWPSGPVSETAVAHTSPSPFSGAASERKEGRR